MSTGLAKDYYRILGLTSNAEDVVIRAAFKLLAHRYHPDKWLHDKAFATRRMAEINEAYRFLSKYEHIPQIAQSDFYQVLGVLQHVDDQFLHAAYQALIHKYRRVPARLALIEQAYNTLSHPSRRKRYDFQLSHSLFPQKPAPSLSLWKVYLGYHLAFYTLVAVIVYLVVS